MKGDYVEYYWSSLEKADKAEYDRLIVDKDNLRIHHNNDGSLIPVDRTIHEKVGHTGPSSLMKYVNNLPFAIGTIFFPTISQAYTENADYEQVKSAAYMDIVSLADPGVQDVYNLTDWAGEKSGLYDYPNLDEAISDSIFGEFPSDAPAFNSPVMPPMDYAPNEVENPNLSDDMGGDYFGIYHSSYTPGGGFDGIDFGDTYLESYYEIEGGTPNVNVDLCYECDYSYDSSTDPDGWTSWEMSIQQPDGSYDYLAGFGSSSINGGQSAAFVGLRGSTRPRGMGFTWGTNRLPLTSDMIKRIFR